MAFYCVESVSPTIWGAGFHATERSEKWHILCRRELRELDQEVKRDVREPNVDNG